MSSDFLKEWADQIDWKTRVKSVCKPCWELKYCPYGPLVEDFPLESNPTEKSCRVFGHDCPVFSVAEPLTETIELRNISRTIPRDIQFKVLRRDNQICQICGKNVSDDDIQFDHIIPWAKGGPTELRNIRLLCSDCNLHRSDSFENEFLINGINEIEETNNISLIEMYISGMLFYYQFKAENHKEPIQTDYLNEYMREDDPETAEFIMQSINTFISLFEDNEYGIKPKIIDYLKDRWGIKDSELKSIVSLNLSEQENQELFYSEIKLFSYIGLFFDRSKKSYKKWLKQKIEG